MQICGIDFYSNTPVFLGKDNRNLGNKRIIPIGIYSEEFHNMCSDKKEVNMTFCSYRGFSYIFAL